MRRFALILMLLMLPVVALGATYYVDPMGIDEASGGGEDAPWATIAFAHGQAKVTDGDTLKLAYGTYTETLNISKALTITAAITDPALSPRPIITTAATGSATIMAKASTGAQTYEYLDIRDVEGGGGNYAVVIEADTDTRTFTNCLFTGGIVGCVRATGNNGTLTFEDCTFTGTNNSGTISNYALLVYNAVLEVTDCTVTGTFDDFAMQAASTNLQAVSITGCTIGNSQKFPSGGLLVNAGTSATISNNTISIAATDQAGDIIKVTNVPTTVIDSNDITLLSTSTATSANVINVTSTGTAMPNVRISNNAIRTRQTAGHVIIVGGEASGTHNGKLDGAIIEYNRIWGPVYYGTAANSVTEHGCMIGYSKQGQIRYNYVNGVGYGCIAKAGTGGLQDWAGLGGIHHNITVNCSVNHAIASGVDGVVIEYNTMYQGTQPHTDGRPMIRLKKEDNQEVYCANSVIRNNILYGYLGLGVNRFVSIAPAGHTGTIISGNCMYMPGAVAATTDVFTFEASQYTWDEFTTAGVFPDTGIRTDPKFLVKGKDFRLGPTSPCINPGSRNRLYMGGSVLYMPQWAYGALPPVFEPIKPVE